MPRYFKVVKIRTLAGVDFDALNEPAPSSGALEQLRKRLTVLHEVVAALLCGWPLEEVEEAAWAFALDGWQHVPPLVTEYDAAFHRHYIPLVEMFRAFGAERDLDAIRILFDEFRNRVQFLQSRAGDIRLSAQVDRLTDVAFERIEPALDELLRVIRMEDPRGSLDAFESSPKGTLLVALANYVGRFSPRAGASLTFMQNERVFDKLKQLSTALASGVAGNLLTDSVEDLFRFMSTYHS